MFASSAIALLLLEIGLRLMPPDLGALLRIVMLADDERAYVLRPDARFEFEGLRERLPEPVVWQINPQGLCDDHVIAPRTDRFRIALYGDSEVFGWSVALEDSLARQMGAIDDRVEVLNFGVPGYNIANVAVHIRHTLPQFRPDLVLYLVNGNDFDESLAISRLASRSYVYLWVRWLYGVARAKVRQSEEGRGDFFVREMEGLVRYCERHGVPLVLGFLKWRNRATWIAHATGGDRFSSRRGVAETGNFRLYELNVQKVVRDEPDPDDHLGASAHRKMADLFCRTIAEDAGSSCVPPWWAGASRANDFGLPRPRSAPHGG